MNKNKTNNRNSIIKKVFLNAQILLLFSTVSLLMIASIILYFSDKMSPEGYFYIITGLLAVSDFLVGFYVGIKLKKNGMLNALIHCMPINILYFLISTLLNSFKIDPTILFSFVIVLSSTMLGGICSVNYKSKTKHKRVGQ